MFEIRSIVTGKVQGVGFRDYVQTAAGELELVGWVKNLPDGTVEILAQGDHDTLKEFVEYLHEGSSLSVIEGVSVDWSTAKEEYEEFSVVWNLK